ncbi:MAG: hypothetical protein M1818_004320 [Claussenomyces sp. TS43310]|nr:MAG: hypothetical protein M1818_004320 [Claussenomyces sp. TS43310]
MPSTSRSYGAALSTSSRGSRHSDESYESRSTAPSSFSDAPRFSADPCSQYPHSAASKHENVIYNAEVVPRQDRYPRPTVVTYPLAEQDLCDEPEEYDEFDTFEYDLPEVGCEHEDTETKATTPDDFAQYFPSQKRLYIRHDETTEDGNMNLRVDTTDFKDHKLQMQLFYLRMRDLSARDFSLRRYCRDSGREVCHSTRRYVKPVAQRPAIRRSMSNALASLRNRPHVKRAISDYPTKRTPVRQDSGYASNEDEESYDGEEHDHVEAPVTSSVLPTNTTKLEFSNYAQVDIKRRGTKSSKRYEFEYWGSEYQWKRVVDKTAPVKSVEFRLLRDNCQKPVALIVPEPRTPTQISREKAKGGWVPPCSLWISDPSVAMAGSSDIAEVIVATGLIALVDDCIKQHSPADAKNTKQLTLPLTSLKMDMEFVGPKALVNHMLHRQRSGGSASEESKGSLEHRRSPMKFTNHIEAR